MLKMERPLAMVRIASSSSLLVKATVSSLPNSEAEKGDGIVRHRTFGSG